MKSRGLTPAHQGYRYQDIFTAYFMMRCLAERYDSISVDKKRFYGDIFDDIHIRQGKSYSHYQLKSSRDRSKRFHYSQLLQMSSDIRIDLLFESFLQSDSNEDLYFLCATWQAPEDMVFLFEAQTIRSIHNSSSVSFNLDANAIWPIDSAPVWEPLQNKKYNRLKFVEFCNVFTIELALPISSETLSEPSLLEQELINLVKYKVGVGSYPNQDRDPTDFSALAISLAYLARTQNATHTPNSIELELGLRTDFGKLNQNFPVNFDVFVSRQSFEESLISNAKKLNHQIVLGSPGAGKSWSLTQLSRKLEEQGVCVAKHYCYLEPGDEELERRISTESVFANLLYELSSKNASLRDSLTSRYSSSIESLNEAIKVASEQEDLVVLIIDGLDHINRILSESKQLSFFDTDIVGLICSLSLPDNVVLILGSQPGEHIEKLTEHLGDRVYRNIVPSWNRFEIEALIHSLKISYYRDNYFSIAFDTVIDTVLIKSEGNPLYATFLIKDLLNASDKSTDQNLDDWLELKPDLNGNITSYYQYIFSNIDEGTLLIANILGLIDFGITIDEIKQALPLLAPIVDSSIKHLSPILTDVTGQGGVRIYHESFRRFVVDNQPNANHISHVLQPITEWFINIGFFESAKSYRFLLVLLRRQKDAHKVIDIVTTDFISKSVEFGHPEIAIKKNLDIAIEVASHLKSWSSLTRLAELKRSLHTCFEEKLHDQFSYWETFTKVHGAELTTDRLIFDGIPTLPTRLGLAVCGLIDDAGYVAPWREYLVKDSTEKNANTSSNSKSSADYNESIQHSINRFKGLLATRGKFVGYKRFVRFILKHRKLLNEDYIYELINVLQSYFDTDVNFRLIKFFSINKCINSNSVIGVASLLRARGETGQKRIAAADLALAYLKSRDRIKYCFILGADPKKCLSIARKPSEIDIAVGDYSPEYDNILEWYLSLHANPECYEEELKRIRKGDNWYSQWLEFLLRLAEYPTSNNSLKITEIFNLISENTAPFKGKPRSCDLYHVQPLIIESIIDGLQLCNTEREFKDCISYVRIAMDETGTSMDRSDTGPIQTIPLLRELCAISHLAFAQDTILEFCMEVVKKVESYGTYFESHAEIGMSLAYLLSSFGLHDEAKKEWVKIAQYLCAYGWRKDVTINEILDSLPAIAAPSWQQGKEAFLKSLPLAQSLRRHTDGRETKHAINNWFKSLCHSNLNIALEVLSCTLHDYDGGVSWILDTATHTVLDECFKKSIDSVAYHVLCTTDFNFRYEGDAKERINEELQIIENFLQKEQKLGKKYFENLVKRYFCSTAKYPEEVTPLLEKFAEKNSLKFTRKALAKSKVKDAKYSGPNELLDCIRPKITPKIYLPLNNVKSKSKEADFRRVINFAAGKMGGRGQNSLDSFINYFGYALCEYSETNGEQQAGEFLLIFAEKSYSAYMGDHHPIIDLADGFSRLAKYDLSCIAYALAYVYRKGNRGWGNIGDEFSEHYLLKAFDANNELALNIFSKGVGNLISRNGYNHGITEAIICRLSSIGLHVEASQAWWAAYEVIKHRLPLTEEHNYCWLNPIPLSKSRGWSIQEGIIAVLLAKLDSPYVATKHQVLLAIKHLIETGDSNLIKPLTWYLSESALVTSIEVLLALLLKYDTSTCFISEKIKTTLELLADSPLWIIKNSSRAILRKFSECKHQDYIIELSSEPLEKRFVQELLAMDKSGKTFFISSIWKNFAQTYADTLSFRLTNSKFNKEQWKERLHLMHGETGDCYPSMKVLGWDEELAEMTTNEVLNNLDFEQQILTDSYETSDIAISLLPDVEAYIVFQELQCIRGKYPLPLDIYDASKKSELNFVVDDSQYDGWIRAAYIEQQWLFDTRGYSKVAKEKIEVQSALAIEPLDYPAPEGTPPFYFSEDISWDNLTIDGADFPIGLCFGIGEYSSFLGEIQILIPHPNLISALNLSLSSRFTLKDETGEDVVIFRNWQKIYENSYDIDVVELQGSEILMHPKLIDRISNISGCNIIVLTTNHREKVDNPIKGR